MSYCHYFFFMHVKNDIIKSFKSNKLYLFYIILWNFYFFLFKVKTDHVFFQSEKKEKEPIQLEDFETAKQKNYKAIFDSKIRKKAEEKDIWFANSCDFLLKNEKKK